jgi:hypothetical protein
MRKIPLVLFVILMISCVSLKDDIEKIPPYSDLSATDEAIYDYYSSISQNFIDWLNDRVRGKYYFKLYEYGKEKPNNICKYENEKFEKQFPEIFSVGKDFIEIKSNGIRFNDYEIEGITYSFNIYYYDKKNNIVILTEGYDYVIMYYVNTKITVKYSGHILLANSEYLAVGNGAPFGGDFIQKVKLYRINDGVQAVESYSLNGLFPIMESCGDEIQIYYMIRRRGL